MPVCWKARAVLPKNEALALSATLEEWEPMPVVSAFELGERGLWEVEAFFADEPDPSELEQRLGVAMRIVAVEEDNWVARALDGLPPVETSRFFVYGEHSADLVPANKIGLRIEASYAFGTGHHGTTKGCLLAFERLSRARVFRNALDLGCGTGILGIAFARSTRKTIIATDIDALATEKAIDNARLNQAGPYLRANTANGFRSPLISAHAPYELIFANILAGPLLRLLPGIKQNLSKNGYAILSGLLDEQANAIISKARAVGLRLIKRSVLDSWVTLILQRPC